MSRQPLLVTAAAISYFNFMMNIPVGCIIGWAKSLVGTPQTLPQGFVECNGQVLSDPQSVFNGRTMPDMNDSPGGTEGRVFLTGGPTSGVIEDLDLAAAADPGDVQLKAYSTVWIIRVK